MSTRRLQFLALPSRPLKPSIRSFLRQSKMSKIPFHPQSAPLSSRRPSTGNCRLPPISIPPPGPHPHTIANHCVLPLPPPSLPPISSFHPPPVDYPPTKYSRRYLIPSSPAPQIGSNAKAHPLQAHEGVSFRGAGCTSSAPSSVDPGIERHLQDLEVFARLDSGEEKGKAYLGVWLALRELGLRDKQNVRLFIAKTLMPYPWFKGDGTVGEVLNALCRLEFINAGLIAKKHNENAMWIWDKKIGDVTVREYWIEEGRKQRQKLQLQAQARARAQAQAQR